MIRHIVMFSFKPEAEGRTKDENVALTKAMLEQLPSKIGLIRASRVEVNAPGASEENCDLLLISDFDSLEDLQAYQVHPDHVAVGPLCGRCVRGGRAWILRYQQTRGKGQKLSLGKTLHTLYRALFRDFCLL